MRTWKKLREAIRNDGSSPTGLDRWIQPMLLPALQPRFDPSFSPHSFGFRLGPSAPDAVRASQNYVRAGKD